MSAANIFPIYDTILSRADKENLLNQKALVIWLSGLSGSGKSTIAKKLERQLHSKGFFCALLDGDNLRNGLNADLGFSIYDREENLRRTAEVAKLFVSNGIIVICSFITPTEYARQKVRQIIGKENMSEIYINCPVDICEGRDVKGLYKKARSGEIKDFTGISSPFEEPLNAGLELRTDLAGIDECAETLFQFIHPKIQLPK